MFGGSSVDVCGGPVLQRGGALRRINGRGLWRGEAKGEEGGLRAIVAGCNQSSANTGTLSHTYTLQHSSGDRAVPAALPPCGCDTLTQITHYRGQRGASRSASGPSSSPPHMHIHTHVDSRIGFPAVIITGLLIQG